MTLFDLGHTIKSSKVISVNNQVFDTASLESLAGIEHGSYVLQGYPILGGFDTCANCFTVPEEWWLYDIVYKDCSYKTSNGVVEKRTATGKIKVYIHVPDAEPILKIFENVQVLNNFLLPEDELREYGCITDTMNTLLWVDGVPVPVYTRFEKVLGLEVTIDLSHLENEALTSLKVKFNVQDKRKESSVFDSIQNKKQKTAEIPTVWRDNCFGLDKTENSNFRVSFTREGFDYYNESRGAFTDCICNDERDSLTDSFVDFSAPEPNAFVPLLS